MKIKDLPAPLIGRRRHVQMSLLACAALMLTACGTMRSSVVVEPAAGTVYNHSATLPRPMASTSATVPSEAHTPIPGGSYVVAKGDTLYAIAFRNGVDVRDLAKWNGVVEPYTIWPGQRLALSPSATSSKTPMAVASAPVAPGEVTSASPTQAAPVFEPVASQPVSTVNPRATQPAAATTATTQVSTAAPIATSIPTPAPTHVATATSAAAVIVPVAGVPTPATVPPPAAPAPGVSRAVSGVSWRWPAEGKITGRFSSSDAIPGIEIAGKAGDAVRAAAEGVVVYSGNGLVGYGELVIIKHNDSFLSAYGHNHKRLVKEGQRVSVGQQIAEMGSTGATRNELEFQIRKDGNPVDPLGYLPSR